MTGHPHAHALDPRVAVRAHRTREPNRWVFGPRRTGREWTGGGEVVGHTRVLRLAVVAIAQKVSRQFNGIFLAPPARAVRLAGVDRNWPVACACAAPQLLHTRSWAITPPSPQVMITLTGATCWSEHWDGRVAFGVCALAGTASAAPASAASERPIPRSLPTAVQRKSVTRATCPVACFVKKRQLQGKRRKRLKGFEPSTFCMASRTCSADFRRICRQTGGSWEPRA
jgi:hypothetical protein